MNLMRASCFVAAAVRGLVPVPWYNTPTVAGRVVPQDPPDTTAEQKKIHSLGSQRPFAASPAPPPAWSTNTKRVSVRRTVPNAGAVPFTGESCDWEYAGYPVKPPA